MNTIQTVIWDCDGVMWFHYPWECKIMSNKLGIPDFKEEFLQMLDQFYRHFEDKRVTRGEMYDVIEETMPILFHNKISPKKFMKIWSELKFQISELNAEVVPVMDLLSKKGYRQVVKTDWWLDVQKEQMEAYGILKYIDKIYACDSGYLKVNPKSAKEVIASGKEDQYIIVGDSLKSDVAFAQNAGIQSVWFNRNRGFEEQNDTKLKPTYEVGSLLEMLDIL